jgi:hypothetical protein
MTIRGLRPLLLALALASPHALAAQASATLAPTDPAHRDLARLAALGYVDTLLLGQRPLTRAAVGRAVREARARLEGDAHGATAIVAREILHRLSADSAHAAPVRRLALDLDLIDDSRRALRTDNGLGGIDARIDPFLGDREGRRIGEGATAAIEATGELLVGRYLALVAQPRLWLGSRGQDPDATLDRAYARLVIRNVALQVGRDHLLWGQGAEVGTLFSAAGPALDMVMLGHERPFVLPSLLRRLGPTRLSFVLARLDRAQNFPHPYVATYKASILPARWLELGAHLYTKGGGEGGPAASFRDRVSDATHFVDVLFRGDDDYQFSDKYAGVDFRLRIPPAAGAELYGEVMLNDLDFNRFGSSVGEDASHVLGIRLPRVTTDGRVDATLELRHTGIRQYRHHQFTSGHTLRGMLLGDPLGPDARGGYLSVGWSPSTWSRVSLDLAREERRGDEYEDVTGGARTIDFERTLARPAERRTRGVAGWEAALRDGALRLVMQVGIEAISNVDSTERDSTGYHGRFGVELRPSLGRAR